MQAEAVHSLADCANQLLLLLGLRRANAPALPEYPLGMGKAIYFWSFLVAMLLFSLGGLFSVYEGWHKMHSSEELKYPNVAFIVLGISIVLESFSLYGALKEFKEQRGKQSFWQALSRSRNAELIVVLGEDIAAILGLALAFLFLLAAVLTGNRFYDALGSLSIGVLLIGISIFLASRIKRLLIGQSSDPELEKKIQSMIEKGKGIDRVYRLITLQLGPDIMLAVKFKMKKGLSIEKAVKKINAIEKEVKETFPEIRWCFFEPDDQD